MKILFLNPAPIIKYGMKRGFEKCGWDTCALQTQDQNYSGFKKALDREKPDYVFMEGGINAQDWVFPVVKETGVLMIYWAIEDPVWVDTLSMEWAEHSCLVATTSIEVVEKYQKRGHQVICIPFAAEPDFHYTHQTNTYSHLDAVLIANNYNYHSHRHHAYKYLLQPLIQQNSKLEIYGLDWCNQNHKFHVPNYFWKGYMPYEETLKAYSSAKMVLGVHSVIDSFTMQSMRTFEVLGCGGFFFSSYAKSLETMFENHKHLVFSRNEEETIELFNFYLKNSQERERIAKEGQKFVYEYHTYEQRARDIINALGEGIR